MGGITYREAGVDIDAGNRAVQLMKEAVQATYGPEVLWGIGAFGGLFEASALKHLATPVLVASTDGVGTKTKIAQAVKRYDTIGVDLVHHCVNDILVQGARPLFFLDYVAAGKLEPTMVAEVVKGIAAGCRGVGCALLGGETAEMPGVYEANEFDLVGTIIGVVERSRIIDGKTIGVGDGVIGLASSGLHTNGYSLARRVLAGWDFSTTPAGGETSLGDMLLQPHRVYLPAVNRLQEAGLTIKGMAHITGGGLIDNPPRILPAGLSLRLWAGSWPVPPIFRLLQQVGQLEDEEMMRVFNLGLGMLVVVPEGEMPAALQALHAANEPAWAVGQILPELGGGRVELR